MYIGPGGVAVTAAAIAGHTRVNDFYNALCDETEDIGVICRGHTIGVALIVVARIIIIVNQYRVGYPDIASGDYGDFAFYDLIDIGKGGVGVASDYDVAIDVNLTAGVACIAAEGLCYISVGNINGFIIAVIRVKIVIGIDIVLLKLSAAAGG